MPATCSGLSEEQLQTYFREGYLVVEDLVPESTIDAVLVEAAKTPVVVGGSWTPRVFDHENPDRESGLHRILVEPSLVDAVESILESPARVYYGMLAVVPAQGGKGLDWHQDNMYDVVLGRALNTFVALCDITPNKAILWVAPRTHLMGVQESLTTEGHRIAATPENGMPLPTLKKGSAVIFDRNTLHHSRRNETNEHRYAYAAQYQEDKARNSAGIKDPLLRRVDDLRLRWQSLS
ncbi:MAG TPA: phytanoyl-CoA dioxygenase family protein [Fimbriimonas sp.]|nr:phytanoyl-CoA dioxygenase family protein [Fimbriimonas sp.]